MSIELNLESIAKSLAIIADHYSPQTKLPLAPVAAVPAPVAAAPAPVVPVPAAPAPAPAVVPAVVPAPAPVPASPAPFADAAGLMEYVKSKYRALGPIKGAMIQNVLTEIGCRNINDVTPGNYGIFFQKVEALS